MPSKKLGRLPLRGELLASIITSVFEELHVGASMHTSATKESFDEWYPLHTGPNALGFEIQHGSDAERWPYNQKSMERAHRDRKPVLGRHAGLADFFVPLGQEGDGVRNTLVVGPFALSPPTSGELLSRWRWMTGRHGRLGNPLFSRYLSIVLSTLTLDARQVEDFERLLGCYARLLEPEPDRARLSSEAQELRTRLTKVRSAERMWEGARTMIDHRTARAWGDANRTGELLRLGVTRVPESVMVGLLLGRERESQAIEDLLRRDAFQRACVEFARQRGGLVSGRLGDHGVALLLEDSSRTRRTSLEVTEKVSAVAKRFDLRIHWGLSARGKQSPGSDPFREALSAAEEALSRGTSVLTATEAHQSGSSPLRALRRQLGQAVEENPSLLSPRFQRYFEVASARAAHRLELVRVHLEAGFDQLADALSASGLLDEKSFAELCGTIEHDAVEAETVNELGEVYRRVVSDIEQALSKPTDARRERSFRRAVAYIRDHLGEPLDRAKVARIAGFAEHYFSKRFVDSEGLTFQSYVRKLRVERSKQMLSSTTLSVEQIGELCGFPTRAQFHRSFKALTGKTPSAFRSKSR